MNTFIVKLGMLAMLVALLTSCSHTASTQQTSRTENSIYEGLPFDMPQVEQPSFPDYSVNIKDFGAKADGKTLNTQAIIGISIRESYRVSPYNPSSFINGISLNSHRQWQTSRVCAKHIHTHKRKRLQRSIIKAVKSLQRLFPIAICTKQVARTICINHQTSIWIEICQMIKLIPRRRHHVSSAAPRLNEHTCVITF